MIQRVVDDIRVTSGRKTDISRLWPHGKLELTPYTLQLIISVIAKEAVDKKPYNNDNIVPLHIWPASNQTYL